MIPIQQATDYLSYYFYLLSCLHPIHFLSPSPSISSLPLSIFLLLLPPPSFHFSPPLLSFNIGQFSRIDTRHPLMAIVLAHIFLTITPVSLCCYTGCSLNIVGFFLRILESLPPLPRQNSAAIGCTANRSDCTIALR